MDYIPSDMLRGHLDTIILLSLVDNDKHTNQIKDVIEKRSGGQFVLKQGTFYSCLQRITKQGYVTEYRTTDEDGVRRKFFQLTEKGKTFIDSNKDSWVFSKHILDLLIAPVDAPDKNEKQNEPSTIATTDSEPQFTVEKADEELKNFLDRRIDDEPSENLSNRDLSYIDFTQAETVFAASKKDVNNDITDKFEQLTITEEPTAKKETASLNEPVAKKLVEKQTVAEPVKTEAETIKEPEFSAYNEQDSNYNSETTDYKSVLEKIFGEVEKSSDISGKNARELKYEEGVDVDGFFNDNNDKKSSFKHIKQSNETKKINSDKNYASYGRGYEADSENSFYDFTDVLELANEEGFKIRISSKENKKDIGRILVNKLNLFSSLIFFGILFAETLIVSLLTSGAAELKFGTYLIFLAICALFPIINTTFYLISPKKKARNLPSFKNSIELILIICLNLLLIDVVCCVLGAVDFSSYKELFRYFLYPILFIINLPAYYVIKYSLLQKNAFFE